MNAPEQRKYNQAPWTVRRSKNERAPYDLRSEYERDRGRIIHAPCFRRLQAKTQVLDVAEGDYHRTRLTHTMEVAQIGRGIVQRLKEDNAETPLVEDEAIPDYNLIEAIAFAHDLGHPPFGHNGEVALNYMMRDHQGFEGNGQSLRLVTKLENRASRDGESHGGLDLTRRVLLGILKYPRSYSAARRMVLPATPPNLRLLKQKDWKPPKCYYDSEQDIVDWLAEPVRDDWERFISWKQDEEGKEEAPSDDEAGRTKHKSLDCSIMELADDIAYITHDLEDGIALGFIRPEDWAQTFDYGNVSLGTQGDKEAEMIHNALSGWDAWRESTKGQQTPSLEEVQRLLFSRSGTERRRAISIIIGVFMHSVFLSRQDGFVCDLLAWQAVLPDEMQCLKKRLGNLVNSKVIKSAELQTLEFRGRLMIMQMFEAIQSDPMNMLPEKHRQDYNTARDTGEDPLRVICDFIAGMTDPYATRFYDRLFTPSRGSAFDKL